jgi:hypothetical protein
MSGNSQIPFNAQNITATNNDILNQAGTPNMIDFNSEMQKVGGFYPQNMAQR